MTAAPENAALRVFISAGEPSGDLHASNLLRSLQKAAPSAQFAALGGPSLEAAGAQILHDMMARFSVMGIRDALRVVPAIRRVRSETLEFLDSWRPHAAVLVDFPGFNINLAKHLKKRRVPVFYYICPQVWAWAPWRIHKIARRVDKALVVFPFEEKIFCDAGIDVTYVTHPLGDVFASRPLDEDFLAREPLASAENLIALVPGSRKSEIERGFPVKVAAARIIAHRLPTAVFAVPVLTGQHADLVRRIARDGGLDCHVFVAKTYEVMKLARFAIATSGTAGLELAHFGVPMVVLYRTHPAGLLLKKLILTTPHISLVNILAGRLVVPELVYWRNRAETIAEMALEILTDPLRFDNMKADVRRVADSIERPGASDKAAQAILHKLALA